MFLIQDVIRVFMYSYDIRLVIPRELLFSTVLVCTELDISPGIYGTGMENHGKSDISTGAVGMGAGYQDFFGNCLNGITETIFEWERKKKKNPGYFEYPKHARFEYPKHVQQS